MGTGDHPLNQSLAALGKFKVEHSSRRSLVHRLTVEG